MNNELFTAQNYATARDIINKIAGERFEDADYEWNIEPLNNYLKDKEYLKGKGIILSGVVGGGKTHLLVSVFKIILATMLTDRIQKVSVAQRGSVYGREVPNYMWKRMTSLLLELKSFFDSNNKDFEYIENLKITRALFIDDLGTENITDWARTIFYEIIDDRYTKLKPTFITTNLDKDKIAEVYGDRIMSRLWQSSLIITVKGDDKRLKEYI